MTMMRPLLRKSLVIFYTRNYYLNLMYKMDTKLEIQTDTEEQWYMCCSSIHTQGCSSAESNFLRECITVILSHKHWLRPLSIYLSFRNSSFAPIFRPRYCRRLSTHLKTHTHGRLCFPACTKTNAGWHPTLH